MIKFKHFLLTTFLLSKSLGVFGTEGLEHYNQLPLPIQRVLLQPVSHTESAGYFMQQFSFKEGNLLTSMPLDVLANILLPYLELNSQLRKDHLQFFPALANLLKKPNRFDIKKFIREMNIFFFGHSSRLRQHETRLIPPLYTPMFSFFYQDWPQKLLKKVPSKDLNPHLMTFFSQKEGFTQQLRLLGFLTSQDTFEAGYTNLNEIRPLILESVQCFLKNLTSAEKMVIIAHSILRGQFCDYFIRHVEELESFISPQFKQIIENERKKILESTKELESMATYTTIIPQNLLVFSRAYDLTPLNADYIESVEKKLKIMNTVDKMRNIDQVYAGQTLTTTADPLINLDSVVQNVLKMLQEENHHEMHVHYTEPSSGVSKSNESYPEGLDWYESKMNVFPHNTRMDYDPMTGEMSFHHNSETTEGLLSILQPLLSYEQPLLFSLTHIMKCLPEVVTREATKALSQMNLDNAQLISFYLSAIQDPLTRVENKMVVAEAILQIDPSQIETVIRDAYLPIVENSKNPAFQRLKAAEAIRNLGPSQNEAAMGAFFTIASDFKIFKSNSRDDNSCFAVGINARKQAIKAILTIDPSQTEAAINVYLEALKHPESSDYAKIQILQSLVELNPFYTELAKETCLSIIQDSKVHPHNQIRALQVLTQLDSSYVSQIKSICSHILSNPQLKEQKIKAILKAMEDETVDLQALLTTLLSINE